ncbi:MAG TPA: hypothetical protein VMU50_01135, partial [Polyangia bacterium]|nr:hypothetical protein [Polyangia bacterium]
MRRTFWVTGAIAVVLASPSAARGREKKPKTAPAKTSSCVPADAATIWWSPREPGPGAPLRILAVSETAREGSLQVRAPDGTATAPAATLRGGPPFSLALEIDKAAAGTYEIA